MLDRAETKNNQAEPAIDQARCGLIVNPIAGMGGRVGLKGTDGPMVLAEAQARGAQPQSPERAGRALARLIRILPKIRFLTGEGPLGEDVLRETGCEMEIVANTPCRSNGMTTKGDTERLADAIEQAGVDLILVAGGDGTVRDVFKIVGDRVPLLGIPTGVKMHSALFATSPGLAGDVAAHFLSGNSKAQLQDAEIMDIDEASVRDDRVSTRLFGYCRAPFEQSSIQGPKASPTLADREALWSSAREIVEEMQSGTLYLLGPGSSTRTVSEVLGVPATLLGVDAILEGEVVGTDLSESEILALATGRAAKLIVGIIGGQGCLFGRGNQQFSSDVIRLVGRDNIIVMAGATKLAGLVPSRLFVDTGDLELDSTLAGYMAVRTGSRQKAMMRVDA